MTDICNTICTVICVAVVGFIVFLIVSACKDKAEAHAEENRKILQAEARDRQAQEERFRSLKSYLDSGMNRFGESLRNFFREDSVYTRYHEQHEKLLSEISGMKSNLSRFEEVCESKGVDYEEYGKNILKVIDRMEVIADSFSKFSNSVARFSNSGSMLMNKEQYGTINRAYWASIHNMSEASVEAGIGRINNAIENLPESSFSEIDLEELLKYVWFYASEKEYSSSNFSKVEKMFYGIYKKEYGGNYFSYSHIKNYHIDVELANIYAMKQHERSDGRDFLMGSHISRISTDFHTSRDLTVVASFLMWIGEYRGENDILKYMVKEEMIISDEAKERLRLFSVSAGNVPRSFDVSTNDEVFFFDITALTWTERDYSALFDNFALHNKVITYSLAIRRDETSLLFPQDITALSTENILRKLSIQFMEEYGGTASAKQINCVALSGTGEEKLSGILTASRECPQMGILVHLARIGKNLNIKFYTLFIPNNGTAAFQKQQCLSLYNKLSPSLTDWENSLKDATLTSIQQLLNAVPHITTDKNPAQNTDNFPVF